MPRSVCRALIAVLLLPLSAFFGFVGWNKAFASLEDLARYGSWTVHLPEMAGSVVGWSEMACALMLLCGLARRGVRLARDGALVLVANQLIAAFVHFRSGELAALPQNGVLIALLALAAFLTAKSAAKEAVLP